MIKNLPLICLFFVSFWSFGQTNECGTIEPAGFSEYFDNLLLESKSFNSRGDVIIYPIKAHILRNSSGTGGLTLQQLEEAVAVMNNHFIHSSLQFYLCDGVNYIDNSSWYNFDRQHESLIAQTHEVANMINIYFANSVTNDGNALCGYAYYPGGPDRIVMANSCATNGSTLSHEMGHFFSLPHTHGNSNTTSQGELVDGSNCQVAGDKICDTPADPVLSYTNVNTSCIYIGNEVDANYDPYQPDVKNLMSYARKECRFHFSPMQHEIMEYTASVVRTNFFCTAPALVTEAFLKKDFCPGDSITVNYHVNGVLDPTNIFTVQLSNAAGYFSNPDELGSVADNVSGSVTVPLPTYASGNSFRIRMSSSSPQLVSLSNGKNLRIDSVHPYVSFSFLSSICVNEEAKLAGGEPKGGLYTGPGILNGNFSASLAGTGTHEISYSVSSACTTVTVTQEVKVEACLGLEKTGAASVPLLKLAPNPTRGMVSVMCEGFGAGPLDLQVLNITGKEMFRQTLNVANGNPYQKDLDLSGYAPGIYFIKAGTKTTKLVVF